MKKLFILLASLQLIGCASMFNNTVQPVQIQTADNVKIKARISTPQSTYDTQVPTLVVAEPSSFNHLVVQLTDPCYPNYRYVVRENVHPSYFANLFNLHGFYIDYLNGNMWRYDPMLHIPLNNEDRLSECRKPEQATATSERLIFSPPPAPPPVFNHALHLGFSYNMDSDINGAQFGYQHHLSPHLFIALQVASMDNDRGTYWQDGIVVDKDSRSISVNYYPWTNQSFYLGAGLAQENIRVQYEGDWDYEPTTIYREEHTPAFLNVGWHNDPSTRFFFNTFVAIDLEDFQLTSFSRNSRGSSGWDSLPANEKRDALSQLDDVRRYTHTGINLGFRF